MTSIDPTEPKSTAEEVSDPSPPITDQDQSEPPTPAGDSSESDGGNVSEGGSKEPFANLKLDERHFEDTKKRDQRKAQLVMGPALGESSSGNGKDTVVEGETIAENEEILADLPDDALDLELTHLRLRTLRGLGLQRFKNVEVSHSRSLLRPSTAEYRIELVPFVENLLTTKPSHFSLLSPSTRSYSIDIDCSRLLLRSSSTSRRTR